jgi:hypothetical protein
MMHVMVDTILVASLLLQSLYGVVNGFILPLLPFTHRVTWTDNFSLRKKSTIHAEFSQQSSFATQAKIMIAPPDAPQAFMYTGDTIYVRECYHTYYVKIMDELLGKSNYYFISVTGTPGIGKSMFYLYFLKRYLSENPGKSVITASFDKDRILQDCKLFRPNGIVEKCRDITGKPVIPEIGTVSWPEGINCDLYLYDGPPTIRPLDVKMVAFTSPNFSWLDSMRKEHFHCKLFMSTWDYTELVYANEVLKLNIDKNKLIQRFTLFGGCATYCLSVDEHFVMNAGRD